MAEARGFKAVIEEPTTEGGRVDVGLSKDDLRIALEISVTTPALYELKNIHKCLEAGYSQIVSVSKNVQQLRNIKELAMQELPEDRYKQVQFLSPEETVTFLDSFHKPKKEENIVKGYRVKVNVKKK